MKISELIESRRADWKELEDDIEWVRKSSRRKLDPDRLASFAKRYRSACSDLSLGISAGFPQETIRYLHQLVADGHAMFYRSSTFRLRTWGKVLFSDVPRRIINDPCTWIAMALFWGLFFGSLLGSSVLDNFSVEVAGESTLAEMESMYSEPIGSSSTMDSRSMMTGFYVFNNAGIGLKCFACGIFLGIGSLFILAFNAIFLGSIFGHMLNAPQAGNFITFVTAHGPFELTAIALSAAAGLRLGWGIVDTNGWERGASLRRRASQAIEIALTATVLFGLAAVIEGNISPTVIPYPFKVMVAALSTLLMIVWFVVPCLVYGQQSSLEISSNET